MRNIKALVVVALSVLAVGCGINTSGDETEFPAVAGSAGCAGTSTGGSAGVGGTAQGGSTGSCVTGLQVVCACLGGLKGVQVCNAQHTYDVCVCTQPDAGTSGSGGTSVGGAGGSSQPSTGGSGGSSTGGSSNGGSSQGGSSGVGGTSTGGSSTGGTAGTSQGGSGGSSGECTTAYGQCASGTACKTGMCSDGVTSISCLCQSGVLTKCTDCQSGYGGSSGTGGTAQGGSSGTGGTAGSAGCQPHLTVSYPGPAYGTVVAGTNGVNIMEIDLEVSDCADMHVGGFAMFLDSPDTAVFCKGLCQAPEDWNLRNARIMDGNVSVWGTSQFAMEGTAHPLVRFQGLNLPNLTLKAGTTTKLRLLVDVTEQEVVAGSLYGKRFRGFPFTFSLDYGAVVDQQGNPLNDIGYQIIQVPTIDQDGDGYTVAQGDCNDNNGTVNPGAKEVCGNNQDDNCDGFVDQFCTCEIQRWYRDADGDGRGNPSIFNDWVVCPGDDTAGYVGNDVDCNDNDVTIYGKTTWGGYGSLAAAPELCDGKDNNCNGQVDEGCANTQDKDGDGRTVAQGDCNDNDASIFGPNGTQPAASELCDGKDNDCDGQIDEGCGTPSATKLVCFYRVFLPDVAKHDYYAVLWSDKQQTVSTWNAVWGTFTVLNPTENTPFLFSTYRDPPSYNQWEYSGCQYNNPSELLFEFACYIEKNGNKFATPEVQGVSNGQGGCNLRVVVQASGATDWDTDGFVLPHDCNDLSGDTHPGAPDLVGGADANCNGATDF